MLTEHQKNYANMKRGIRPSQTKHGQDNIYAHKLCYSAIQDSLNIVLASSGIQVSKVSSGWHTCIGRKTFINTQMLEQAWLLNKDYNKEVHLNNGLSFTFCCEVLDIDADKLRFVVSKLQSDKIVYKNYIKDIIYNIYNYNNIYNILLYK